MKNYEKKVMIYFQELVVLEKSLKVINVLFTSCILSIIGVFIFFINSAQNINTNTSMYSLGLLGTLIWIFIYIFDLKSKKDIDINTLNKLISFFNGKQLYLYSSDSKLLVHRDNWFEADNDLYLTDGNNIALIKDLRI